MRLEIPTQAYNHRRESAPWIAVVDFTDPKGTFTFGTWIGDARNGSVGQLEINAEPGDIIARGQKDMRKPANSAPDFLQLVGPSDRSGLRARAAAVFDAAKMLADSGNNPAWEQFDPTMDPSDCRRVLRVCAGEEVDTVFQGNAEVRELNKVEALKAWRVEQASCDDCARAPSQLHAVQTAELVAELERRGIRVS